MSEPDKFCGLHIFRVYITKEFRLEQLCKVCPFDGLLTSPSDLQVSLLFIRAADTDQPFLEELGRSQMQI